MSRLTSFVHLLTSHCVIIPPRAITTVCRSSEPNETRRNLLISSFHFSQILHKTQNYHTTRTTMSSSLLQSEDSKRQFIKSISIISNCIAERQGADTDTLTSEIVALHNLFSIGVNVILNHDPVNPHRPRSNTSPQATHIDQTSSTYFFNQCMNIASFFLDYHSHIHHGILLGHNVLTLPVCLDIIYEKIPNQQAKKIKRERK